MIILLCCQVVLLAGFANNHPILNADLPVRFDDTVHAFLHTVMNAFEMEVYRFCLIVCEIPLACTDSFSHV